MVTHNPLHGSGQTGLPHPALTSGNNAHAPPGMLVAGGELHRCLCGRQISTILGKAQSPLRSSYETSNGVFPSRYCAIL
jgi:hypothetical protein